MTVHDLQRYETARCVCQPRLGDVADQYEQCRYHLRVFNFLRSLA